jgi:hypothetical protein
LTFKETLEKLGLLSVTAHCMTMPNNYYLARKLTWHMLSAMILGCFLLMHPDPNKESKCNMDSWKKSKMGMCLLNKWEDCIG